MHGSSVIYIVETNDKQFLLYGANNGMDVTEGVQNTGVTADSDTTSGLTLQGRELELPYRVLDTDYATTLALLESYEI